MGVLLVALKRGDWVEMKNLKTDCDGFKKKDRKQNEVS